MVKGRKPISSVPLTPVGDKFKCGICGSKIKRQSLSVHIKSATHKFALDGKSKPPREPYKHKKPRVSIKKVRKAIPKDDLEDPFTVSMTAIEPQKRKVQKKAVNPRGPTPKPKPKPKPKRKPPKAKLTQRIPGVLEIRRPKGFTNHKPEPKILKLKTRNDDLIRTEFDKKKLKDKEPEPLIYVFNEMVELIRSIVILLKDHRDSKNDEEAYSMELKIEETEDILNDLISNELRAKGGINRPHLRRVFI